jgi:uncharacterized protein YndB with AHSA1/START domain
VIVGGAVIYDVVFPSPPYRVWRALVEPEELAAWLMPSRGFEPVAGTRFTMACDPLGQIDGEVLEVIPELRLSLRWAGSFGETVVTFELERHGSGTRLRLTHRGWDEAHAAFRERFDSGWNTKLGAGLAVVLRDQATEPIAAEVKAAFS